MTEENSIPVTASQPVQVEAQPPVSVKRVSQDEIAGFVNKVANEIIDNRFKSKENEKTASEEEKRLFDEFKNNLKDELRKEVIDELQKEHKTERIKSDYTVSEQKLVNTLDKMLKTNKWTEDEFKEGVDILKQIPYSYMDLAKIKPPVLRRVLKRLENEDNGEFRRLLRFQKTEDFGQFKDTLEDILYVETKKHLSEKRLKESESKSDKTYTTPSFKHVSTKGASSSEKGEAMLNTWLSNNGLI